MVQESRKLIALRILPSVHRKAKIAAVIADRDSGQSKGFGFVEMSDSEGAKAAIAALDGTDFDGRQIKVNEARPKTERSGGGGGGGRW